MRAHLSSSETDSSRQPILIQYKELTEWLTNRKFLPADWRKRLSVVQLEARNLFNDVTLDVKHSPSESGLSYLDCEKIASELAQRGSHNLFGGLTGPAKAWAKVVRVYKKGNVHLGEAAQTLLNNTDYEIPYLKKRMSNLNAQLIEHEKKAAELTFSAKQAASAYTTQCMGLGIEGGDIPSEIDALLAHLPLEFEGAVGACRAEQVEAAAAYYRDFSARFCRGGEQRCLETLSEVMAGTTEAVAEPVSATGGLESCAGALSAAAPGGGPGRAAGAGGPPEPGSDLRGPRGEDALMAVDWDIGPGPAENSRLEPGEQLTQPAIDWEVDCGAAEIDWDIRVEDGGQDSDLGPAPPGGSSAEAAPPLDGAPAGGVDAPGGGFDPVLSRLAADAAYRSKLLDDLTELQAFLKARLLDSSRAPILLSDGSLDEVGPDALHAMLESVKRALEPFHAPRLHQLLKMKASPQFALRLVRDLEMRSCQESRLMDAVKDVMQRKREAQQQLVSLPPKIADLIDETRKAKNHLEGSLGNLLSRKVHIVGDVNLLGSET